MDPARHLPRTWVGIAALAVVSAFLGGAIVFFATERAGAPPAASSTDVGFLQDMISHHEQALAMSATLLVSGDEGGVQLFAREILQQQTYELGLMDRQLAVWGYAREDRAPEAMGWMGMPVPPEEMPGMASEQELRTLQDARGDDADALFVALMSDHHRGGVHMASAAAEAAGDPWVRELAARMARVQAIEIRELEAARQRLGLSASPPGYEPMPDPGAHDHEPGG